MKDQEQKRIIRLYHRLKALENDPWTYPATMSELMSSWNSTYQAWKVAELMALRPVDVSTPRDGVVSLSVADRVRRIINRSLTDVSIILSPNMAAETRTSLITHLAGSIERIHAKKISLTGLLHCLDLLVNGQPPFDEKTELYGFDVRGISRAIQRYVVEQRKRVGASQPSDETAMSLAERSMALAHCLKNNPEMDRKFKELFGKIQERNKKAFKATSENGHRQYSTLMDYLQAHHRLNLDQIDEVLEALGDTWEEEIGVDQNEYMRQRAMGALMEVNAFGHCEWLEDILQKQKV